MLAALADLRCATEPGGQQLGRHATVLSPLGAARGFSTIFCADVGAGSYQ